MNVSDLRLSLLHGESPLAFQDRFYQETSAATVLQYQWPGRVFEGPETVDRSFQLPLCVCEPWVPFAPKSCLEFMCECPGERVQNYLVRSRSDLMCGYL